MAVERLKGCDNIVALSEELGVHRRLLYKWRDRLEAIDDGEAPPENGKERELRLQVACCSASKVKSMLIAWPPEDRGARGTAGRFPKRLPPRQLLPGLRTI